MSIQCKIWDRTAANSADFNGAGSVGHFLVEEELSASKPNDRFLSLNGFQLHPADNRRECRPRPGTVW